MSMKNEFEFKSLQARIDLNQKPLLLRITGSLHLFEILEDVHLIIAEPQGFNPNELLLELIYSNKIQSVKAIYNPFHFTKEVPIKDKYTTIKIVYDYGESASVPVLFDEVFSS